MDESIDAKLNERGVYRGNAENVDVYVRSVSLQSGAKIVFEHPGVTVIAGANNCGKSLFLKELNAQIMQQGSYSKLIIEHAERIAEGHLNDYVDWLARHAHLADNEHMAQPAFFSRPGASAALPDLVDRERTSAHPLARRDPAFLIPFFVKYLGPGVREVSPVGKLDTVFDAPTDPLHLLIDDANLMDELNALVFKILGKKLVLDDINRVVQLRVGTPSSEYPTGRSAAQKKAYQREVEALPALRDQGDGMRSLLNILIPLVTAFYPVLIIDEPEAFLHPPQAFALGQELGRIAKEKGVQLILATHDRDILAGIVNTSTPSVVRLVREADDVTHAYQLKAADLDEIWSDPVLKYSHVLDGLFHQVAILAEAERDCRFYEAALDVHGPIFVDAEDERGLPPSEVLFIPTSGTSNMPKLARALRSLRVPVIACADLDVLDNESVIKNIVEALGGSWKELADDWKGVTAPLSQAPSTQLAATVYETIASVFSTLLESNPLAQYDGEMRKRINAALKPASRPWDEIKHHGLPALQRLNKQNTETVQRLVTALEDQNVVVVAVGELESFGHELGIVKGKNWLPAALKTELHKQSHAQAHAQKLLTMAARITSPSASERAPQP